MKIQNIIEPALLLMSWQPPDVGAGKRSRRVVAEIKGNGDAMVFTYLKGTADFETALKEDFQGHPAFRLAVEHHCVGVHASLIRRLPPRNRADFRVYLQNHWLDYPFAGSDLALLAYTGARLPGDGFEFFGDFSQANRDFELVFEVAGFRHTTHPKCSLAVDDPVEFATEPLNAYDECAIAVNHSVGRIGYVPKPLCQSLAAAMKQGYVSARIARINGTEQRPAISVFFEVMVTVPA